MLIAVAFYVGAIVTIVVAGLGGAAVANFFPAISRAAGVAVGACAAALVCGLVYAFVRLAFLMPAVAVAERSTMFERSWELSRGNFWRMLAIILSAFLPLLALEIAVIALIFGAGVWSIHGGVRADQLLSGLHAGHLKIRGLLETSKTWWMIGQPLWIVFSVIVYGLFAGQSAYAYRALIPASEPEGSVVRS
jgi:hypothetical protein